MFNMSRLDTHNSTPVAPDYQPSGNPTLNSEQRLQEVMDGLSSSVFVGLLTVDGILTYANQAALNAVSAKPEHLLGMPFESTPWWAFSDDSRRRLRAAIQSAANGVSSRFEFPFQDSSGRRLIMDFTLHPVFSHDGRVAYLIPSAQDVTDRKRAEEALRLTQFAVDHARVALMQIYPDGRLRYVNNSACDLLGYARDTLLGLRVYNFNTRVTEASWSVRWSELKAKGSLRFESMYRHCDGHEIPVEVSVSYIEYEGEEYSFTFVTDLSEHKAAEEHIRYISNYDGLTGLANRTLFLERVAQYASQAASEQHRVAVIIIDVERFKTINDTLGRPAGDQVLKQIADRFVRYRAGEQARLARIGANQFAVVLPFVKSEKDVVQRIEQRLRECFGTPFLVNGTELRVSSKFGVSMFPEDGNDAELLLKHAEAALYKAKATGEKYLFYTQHMNDRTAGTLILENKLRQALEREEFVLYYQPKISLDTGGIASVEALIRWKSPELGLVPPAQFIPLMEETGLILDVGIWALRKAAQDHRHWLEAGLDAPRVAVNVSAIQLRKRDFVLTVQQALEHGVAPTGIDLEITESVVMEDIQDNIEKLKAIRDLGMSIAIDDFGTGYSSLAYLTKLPVETLKIDRSFICTMLDEPDTMTLVSGIISLAHSLRLKVVAEGVETEEQADALRALRCEQMQGYLFSKPLPLEEMTLLLGKQRI
jgi:diguanylate cyclase (GGDEF)-like protein/PAS domain S-box-containing protein